MTRLRTIAALGVLAAAPALADPLASGRDAFRAAMAAVDATGQVATTDSEALRNYPLYPYLQAARLRARIGDPEASADIEAFLEGRGSQPVARPLRRAWLMTLALERRWPAFLDAYREDLDDTVAARCNALAARVALQRTEGLTDAVIATYLAPKSLPPACDPAIDWLRAQGRLTPEIIEQRARLALAEGEAGLARFLARSLPESRAAPLRQWADLVAQPRVTIDALIAAPSRPVETAALLDGWTRTARADADRAAYRYAELVSARGLDARAASPFALAVALPLSWSRSPRALEFFALASTDDFDERAHEWHVRAALWSGDWERAGRSLAAMPEALRSQNRWRYWSARVAELTGDRDAARAGYAAVLPTDNWYAALAAARLGQPVTPSQQPIPRDAGALARVAAEPALVRTRELILVDMESEAGHEWRSALDALAADQQAQAVRLASGWGWHLQAISAAARVGIFNDYELLYPRPFDREVRAAARATGLPESLVYAVIRQESLFRVDARSSADALGLMQLMPETARRTAAGAGLAAPSRNDLLQPAINVKLGSTFLRGLLVRADGQWPIAIAGYNAGPGAARRWLPPGPMEADVWVENIPFNETRNYVQRVHWHSLVFAWLADGEAQDVSDWLAPIQPPPAQAGTP
jgi:soluble lytic murein transglycosylase